MIADIIRAEGPISIERYFQLCVARYYAAREPFGAAGDFITAPEYSQLFGEMIGVWCATVYEAMGKPAGFRLIELGPGRGTLMADALKASRIPAEAHLVETSMRLREKQKAALEAIGAAPVWHNRLADVPAGPAIMLANEFFDALPIQQFERRDGLWHERMVGIGEDGRLKLGLSPAPSPVPLPHSSRDGRIWERSPARETAAGDIAARGGYALIVDYGHSKAAFGDTLQAMRDHRYHDILESPGEADLTSHVDFEALARAIRDGGGEAHGPMEQGAFLKAMGIDVRAARLMQSASEAQRAHLRDSLERLAGGAQMGRLFKVMAAAPKGAPAPYPFGAP
jgi:NADH dehydrogenase [ubiquinone] 1 alpha subcomplex assembly factor 7